MNLTASTSQPARALAALIAVAASLIVTGTPLALAAHYAEAVPAQGTQYHQVASRLGTVPAANCVS